MLDSIELVFGASLAVLAVAVFAVMVWADLRVDRGARILRR